MPHPRPATALRSLLSAGLALLLLAPASVPAAADNHDTILEQTAAVRGLEPKEPVPFEVVDPEHLRAELLSSFEDPEAIRETEISRRLLVMLGLFNPEADLHSLLVDLFAESVLGYYNRADKKMHVISTGGAFGSSEKVTLAHEYTHALQDQHFDLARLQEGTEENSDHSLAITALVEGDATLTMILYARDHLTDSEVVEAQSDEGPSSIDSAPLVIRDEVLFPYREGALFAMFLWATGGFEAINAAYADPPRSTEQIMHPEKYLAGEAPIEVTLPDLAGALGDGWTRVRSDVLGEIDMRILLEEYGDPVTASAGAAGWGGDRYAVLESESGESAFLLSSVWDSEDEAGEFFNLYADSVGRRFGRRATKLEEGPGILVWSTPSGAFQLQAWGPRVALAIAPDEAGVRALAGAVAPTPETAPGPQPAPAQLPR